MAAAAPLAAKTGTLTHTVALAGVLPIRTAMLDSLQSLGYVEVEPAQVGLFFTLLQKRHKQRSTLITSNLGFSEWASFLKNPHLTAALIDRLTESSHVFNLKEGVTLRDPMSDAS